MATATCKAPTNGSMGELLEYLGSVPAARVRLWPPPGRATERDVIAIEVREQRLCELVDGVLVEKPMGYYESRLAAALIFYLELFLTKHNLGAVAGEAGMMRLAPHLVRIPDVSFVSWKRFRKRKIPRTAIPDLVPDLAVEILSEANTVREMERKLREYFDAGVSLVWVIDPSARTVTVYTSTEQRRVLHKRQILRGGKVLPGFRLPLRELFARADRGETR